jgi:hypothetical protein
MRTAFRARSESVPITSIPPMPTASNQPTAEPVISEELQKLRTAIFEKAVELRDKRLSKKAARQAASERAAAKRSEVAARKALKKKAGAIACGCGCDDKP